MITFFMILNELMRPIILDLNSFDQPYDDKIFLDLISIFKFNHVFPHKSKIKGRRLSASLNLY